MSNEAANASSNKNQREELGALWKKEGKNQTYLTGYITSNGQKVKIVVFSSKNKKSENQPDYRIYESLPIEGRSTNTPQTAQKSFTKPAAKPAFKKAETAPAVEDDEDGLL